MHLKLPGQHLPKCSRVRVEGFGACRKNGEHEKPSQASTSACVNGTLTIAVHGKLCTSWICAALALATVAPHAVWSITAVSPLAAVRGHKDFNEVTFCEGCFIGTSFPSCLLLSEQATALKEGTPMGLSQTRVADPIPRLWRRTWYSIFDTLAACDVLHFRFSTVTPPSNTVSGIGRTIRAVSLVRAMLNSEQRTPALHPWTGRQFSADL